MDRESVLSPILVVWSAYLGLYKVWHDPTAVICVFLRSRVAVWRSRSCASSIVKYSFGGGDTEVHTCRRLHCIRTVVLRTCRFCLRGDEIRYGGGCFYEMRSSCGRIVIARESLCPGTSCSRICFCFSTLSTSVRTSSGASSSFVTVPGVRVCFTMSMETVYRIPSS